MLRFHEKASENSNMYHVTSHKLILKIFEAKTMFLVLALVAILSSKSETFET